MIRSGQLTVDHGIARLDGVRLVKDPQTGDGFGQATTFLVQDRRLTPGSIWVRGTPDTIGNVNVIVITEAGLPPAPAI